MRVILAYMTVLLIWSTTPLAIQWSSEGIHFLLSVAIRMILATLCILPILFVVDKRLPLNPRALASYLAGSLGIWVAMSLVYWSAKSVSSGLISVLFGLAPLLTGIQAFWLLGEPFVLRKWLGLLCSLLGLGVIFMLGSSPQTASIGGMLALIVATALYSLGSIMVKHIRAPVTPLQQTSGSLLLTSIGFIWLGVIADISWAQLMLFDPLENTRGFVSLLYLALICSAVGFFLMFYVLSRVSAGVMSLTTLITPVIALVLGNQLNQEPIDASTVIGAGLIGLGLIGYEWPQLKQLAIRLFARIILRARATSTPVG